MSPTLSTQDTRYHLPALLRDIRLLDLLELCGTTVHASRLLQLSQPTISRRYQTLAEDFGLVRHRYPVRGCSYGTSTSMRLLRLACRSHRLTAGVARIGSDMLHQPLLAGCPWVLPTPVRFRAAASWLELVRQGILDGALISGLELDTTGGESRRDLVLLPLESLPLALACCSEATDSIDIGTAEETEVLVPNRGVAPGLRRVLEDLGLSLRNGGNSLRTATDWIRRIQGSTLMLVVADCDAESWSTLHRWPLPTHPRRPVWLVLPADWQEAPVLRHTALRLGAVAGGDQQQEQATDGTARSYGQGW